MILFFSFFSLTSLLAGPWSTAFSLEEEHKITQDKLLATIPLLKREWKVSFDFKASGFSGLAQVLHLTTGGKGAGSGAKYGDRTPAIWTHSTKGFLISSAVGGRFSYSKYFKALPAAGEWINIQVGQELQGSQMIYYIYIGGKTVFSTRNSKPSEFVDVQVFSSSKWYSPVNGLIKNLVIENKNEELDSPWLKQTVNCMFDWETAFSLPSEHQLKRGSLLTTLPTLTKEWKVSFELRASSYQYKSYAQILQMTIGGKSGNIGDRTPALWIHKTRGVYLTTTLGSKSSVGKFFKTKKPPINEWTSVEISQTRKGSKYIFSFTLKGETLWTVENSDPREFSSVKVFASSDWYVAQAGAIRGFKIENMMPGEYLILYI